MLKKDLSKMKILKILLLLCSLLFSLSLFADDDYHEKDHSKYKKNHFYKNLDFLELNKIQYSNLRNILIENKKNQKEFYAFKLQKEKKLRALMQKEVFDTSAYESIKNEITTYSNQLEATQLKRIHEVLTKEQREKFSYFLQEWEVE